MPTPFAPFANARLRWERRAAPANLRDGLRRAAVATIVVELFLEPDETLKRRATPDQWGEGTAQASQGRNVTGYITRWATLPDGADWLDAGSSWTWDDSGLRPAGMKAGEQELQAALVNLRELPAVDRAEIGTLVLTQLGSPYGPGGIGQLISSVAGELVEARFQIR
jgi:hypothetical protein